MSHEQTYLWGKTERGWISITTPPLGLYETPSREQIQDYVEKCMPNCMQEAGSEVALALRSWKPVHHQAADQTALRDAARLWTANHLLMKGWQASGVETVTKADNPYCGMRPAPRVLQNGLDQALESYVADIEQRLLHNIFSIISSRMKHTPWDSLFSAVLILLAVMEKDIWRLIYWVRHREEVSPSLMCPMFT